MNQFYARCESTDIFLSHYGCSAPCKYYGNALLGHDETWLHVLTRAIFRKSVHNYHINQHQLEMASATIAAAATIVAAAAVTKQNKYTNLQHKTDSKRQRAERKLVTGTQCQL